MRASAGLPGATQQGSRMPEVRPFARAAVDAPGGHASDPADRPTRAGRRGEPRRTPAATLRPAPRGPPAAPLRRPAGVLLALLLAAGAAASAMADTRPGIVLILTDD